MHQVFSWKFKTQLSRRCWLCLSAVCLSFVVGCGSDSGVIPVLGTVEFTGRDRPEVCRITFVPKSTEEGIRPGGATMTTDGAFELTEFKGVKGLPPGTYAVRLSYFDLKPGGNPDLESDWREKSYEAEDLVVPDDVRQVTHQIVVDSKK